MGNIKPRCATGLPSHKSQMPSQKLLLNHLDTGFLLTDLLTNWVARGIIRWYNKATGYPVSDTKQGYMTRKNTRGDDLQWTAKPLFTGSNPVVASISI